MKNLLTALLLALCLTAMASDRAAIPVGNATEFSYHARYLLSGSGRHIMRLEWPHDTDSSQYKASVEILASSTDDPLFPAKTRYEIQRISGDSSSVYAKGDFECRIGREPSFSIVLRRTPSGAALSLGADKAVETIAVPFSGDSLIAEAGEGAAIQRHSLIIRSIQKHSRASFDSLDSLLGYIAASNDPMESVWEYLDRDINPSEARLGGKYIFATVLAPDGYDIVYIDGAEKTSGDWKSLDIKGKLTNTAFDGHYDLTWLAAPRHEADTEASATIGIGGEVLEFNFPTLRSRLRFRRASDRTMRSVQSR